jgi:hypothetical protein
VPRGPSGRVWEISLTPGVDPRTVQALASRCTDYAIPAQWLLLRWLRNPLTEWSHEVVKAITSINVDHFLSYSSSIHSLIRTYEHLTQPFHLHPRVARFPRLPFLTARLDKSRVTTVCTVAPNICRYSVWSLLHLTVEVPRNLSCLLLVKFCEPLLYRISGQNVISMSHFCNAAYILPFVMY